MNQQLEKDKYVNDNAFMAYLESMMPESKKKKIAQVLPFRTRHVVTVIENVLDSNNTNAILRTSEALGIQDAHLVYGNIKYIPQKSVSKGAHLWMDTFKYGNEFEDNAINCIHFLKGKGYQLVVTSPDAKNTIDDIDIDKPMAVCFGQESKGVSNTFLSHAAIAVSLPQYGFTDSYNVAVAAGMTLLPLLEKVRKSNLHWQLTDAEKKLIYKTWLMQYHEPVEAHFKRYQMSK